MWWYPRSCYFKFYVYRCDSRDIFVEMIVGMDFRFYLWEFNILSHNVCNTQTQISLNTAKNGHILTKNDQLRLADRVKSSSLEQKVSCSIPAQGNSIFDQSLHPNYGFRLSTTEIWKSTFPILAHPELRKYPISGKFQIANITRIWIVSNVSLSENW